MARLLKDWITYYLEYTDDTEPPESYHIWTAISIIAGSLARKVHIPWGHSKIYPNLYVILVGSSGRTRKGVAMDIGQDIFTTAGGIITADALTKERLIKSFKEGISNFSNPTTGFIEYHCSMTTFSKELAVFLGQKDVGFLADLTDWYDSHDSWKYETKNKGSDHIHGVCYNLLGGTAPDWFQSMLPLEAIGGGFTARIIFIAEEHKRKIVADPDSSDSKLRKVLISDLQKITATAGEFSFSDDAKDRYIKWYIKEEEKMKAGKYAVDDPRFYSYCERRATHIKKVGMAISASRNEDMIITLEDFNRSLVILEAAEKKMFRVFGGLGASVTGPILQKIITALVLKGKVKRSELLAQFKFDITSLQLEEIEKALQMMRYIRVEMIDNNKDHMFIYIGPQVK